MLDGAKLMSWKAEVIFLAHLDHAVVLDWLLGLVVAGGVPLHTAAIAHLLCVHGFPLVVQARRVLLVVHRIVFDDLNLWLIVEDRLGGWLQIQLGYDLVAAFDYLRAGLWRELRLIAKRLLVVQLLLSLARFLDGRLPGVRRIILIVHDLVENFRRYRLICIFEY